MEVPHIMLGQGKIYSKTMQPNPPLPPPQQYFKQPPQPKRYVSEDDKLENKLRRWVFIGAVILVAGTAAVLIIREILGRFF